MNHFIFSNDTKISTINGTLLVILYSINMGELFKYSVLAAIGATVSFIVSQCCRWAWNKFRKRTEQEQS